MANVAEIFISYAKEDERWLKELTTHLENLRLKGMIAPFDDRQISIGDEWDEEIKRKLHSADLVILIVTKHFLASPYINKEELSYALQRSKVGEVRLLPIIFSTCYWQGEEFAQAQAYPRPGPEGVIPVAKWQDPDEPLAAIAKELWEWASDLIQRRAAAASAHSPGSSTTSERIDLDLYLQQATRRWEAIDLTALAVQSAAPTTLRPTLTQLFVPPDCRQARPPHNTAHDWIATPDSDLGDDEDRDTQHAGQWQAANTLSTLDLLATEEAGHLVVLGAPGSGKSSLARFIALELLRPGQLENVEPWRKSLDGYIPFLVELRELVSLDRPGKPCSIPEYLADLGERLKFGFRATAVEEQLQNGSTLLIVDGLDEVFEPGRRRQLAFEVIGLATFYKRMRVLITSRIAGFDASLFESSGFLVATLESFSDDQIETFVKVWFDKMADSSNATTTDAQQNFLRTLAGHPQLGVLGGNPLMLTVMAIVAKSKPLARSRVELYDQILNLLCYSWEYRKGLKLPPDSPLIDLDPDDTLRMLRTLAWRMQEGGGLRANSITSMALMEALEGFFDVHWKVGPARARRAAREMTKLLEERTWVVAARGPALFGFVHRTFLEYLCAQQIFYLWSTGAMSDEAIVDFCIPANAVDDTKHEIVRLVSTQLPVELASKIVSTLVAHPTFGSYSCDPFTLALECLAEQRAQRLEGMMPVFEMAVLRLYDVADCVWPYDPRENSVEQEWYTGVERIESAIGLLAENWPMREEWLERHGLPTLNDDVDAPPYVNRYEPILSRLISRVFSGLPGLPQAISKANQESGNPWASAILRKWQ